MHNNRHINGFSLFEVLTVLAVVSLASVAGLQYYKGQQEKTIANDYGRKLYLYGQAAQQYVSDSTIFHTTYFLQGTDPDGHNPLVPQATLQGDDYTTTIVGVNWLKEANAGKNAEGQPYLDDQFSFAKDVRPLIIAQKDEEGNLSLTNDDAITTTISFSSLSSSSPYRIAVTTGALYSFNGTDPQSNLPLEPVVKPTLTQQAISTANTYYTPESGIPALEYKFPYDVSAGETPENAPVEGRMSQEVPDTDFIKLDGSNFMQNTLSFEELTGHAIRGIAAIEFNSTNNTLEFAQDNAKHTLTNLDKLTGQGLSTIDKANQLQLTGLGSSVSVKSLSFNSAGSPSKLLGPKSLAFRTTDPGNTNRITNLGYIEFTKAPISKFYGIGFDYSLMDANSNGPKVSYTNGMSYFDITTQPQDVCFLTTVSLYDDTSGSYSPNEGCEVYRSGSKERMLVSNNSTNSVACTAGCLQWSSP
jgi:prepilin-type N-terminal cleavage/methylation domain-containing protein